MLDTRARPPSTSTRFRSFPAGRTIVCDGMRVDVLRVLFSGACCVVVRTRAFFVRVLSTSARPPTLLLIRLRACLLACVFICEYACVILPWPCTSLASAHTAALRRKKTVKCVCLGACVCLCGVRLLVWPCTHRSHLLTHSLCEKDHTVRVSLCLFNTYARACVFMRLAFARLAMHTSLAFAHIQFVRTQLGGEDHRVRADAVPVHVVLCRRTAATISWKFIRGRPLGC